MTTVEQVRGEFIAECSCIFDFLIKEYGFAGPEIHFLPEVKAVIILFSKLEIAVECVLDLKDEGVSVQIVRADASVTDVTRVNDEGQVIRDYLTQLLIRRGIRDIKFEAPADYAGLSKTQAYFRKALLGYARLIKKYGQDILDGSASIFETK